MAIRVPLEPEAKVAGPAFWSRISASHPMKHSPTPWTRGTDGLIFDANGEYVTDTCGTSLPEGEENQKLIVDAVN